MVCYLEDLGLVPYIVPHIFVEQNIFVLLRKGTLPEKVKGHHRMHQLIKTTLNHQKGTFVVLK